MFDVQSVRKDFPILARKVNGHRLVYLDNGASAQKPRQVLTAIQDSYEKYYANVHRGLHFLSNYSTEKYEEARGKIARFLNARESGEIILTTGTTHGINLVAYGWAMPRFKKGDEIIISALEHHANIVPWHFLRERMGCVIKWVEPAPNGDLDPQKFEDLMGDRTRLVAVTQTSNVLGTIVDVRSIAEIAHRRDIPVLVDASQSAVHMKIDVQELDVDFLAVTGHKLYGPSASGALYVSQSRLDEFVPFMGGGDMIEEVTRDHITYAKPPHKLEAGTPPIVQIIGLGHAIDYVTELGMNNIREYESKLTEHARNTLAELEWLELHGYPTESASIFSFTLDGQAHPHDISTILDQQGIAVRAGHHCAQPLMEFLNVTATCRASFGMYNTIEEVDLLAEGLKRCNRLFN